MATENPVTVRHALPHRVHLAAPRLAWHRAACERVARALSETGYARVAVRPETGGVIVEDENALDTAVLAAQLRTLVLTERDEDGRLLADPSPKTQPGPTRVARSVAHAMSGLNADVRAALDGRADLGTLLPVVFAAGGIFEAAYTRKMPWPSWFNLLWWSMRWFMTFNIDAIEGEPNSEMRAAKRLRVG